MQANVGKNVRGHLETVGVGAIVLFFPPRLVCVGGHGVCTTGTIGASACHTPKVSWASLLGTNGHVKEVTSIGRLWWVPTTTRPRGNNVQMVHIAVLRVLRLLKARGKGCYEEPKEEESGTNETEGRVDGGHDSWQSFQEDSGQHTSQRGIIGVAR